MMKDAGILDRYGSVLAEFPVVVRAGGAWTSVTPGSQQYWLQAFNNVLYGRWKKIDDGYGRAVLGYFGRTPLAPDPEVVAAASAQLGRPPFDGDPMEAAADTVSLARDALAERGLPITDESVFLVAAAITPGKAMDLNEGIRFLSGRAKVVLPFKPAAAPVTPAPPPAASVVTYSAPFTTSCTVSSNGQKRRYRVTFEPPTGAAVAFQSSGPAGEAEASAPSDHVPVFSPFQGKAELVALAVKVGDTVEPGQVIAAVEVMKARHDVRAPSGGRVVRIDALPGDDVTGSVPILLLGR
jgi:pyruvate carboxylase subunit B